MDPGAGRYAGIERDETGGTTRPSVGASETELGQVASAYRRSPTCGGSDLASYIDLLLEDGRFGLGKTLGGRRVGHRAILD
jgi:hypothetical protein